MIVAFVPVRIGSKSIPLKNIKLFCGKPLIYWTLNALVNSNKVDKVYVGSDSEIINEVVNGFNFSKVEIFNRDANNAQDNSTTESVLLEFISINNFSPKDKLILAQVTSPFTTSEMINQALNNLQVTSSDSLLSVVRFKRFVWNEDGKPFNYNYLERPRRQDFKGLLLENGAFYINSIGNIVENKNRISGRITYYEMPEYSSIEIDEPSDWEIAENLFYTHCFNKKTAKNIKLVISDVDGVLTDSGMYYSETGDELKKFNTRDGMGFELLKNQGIKTGIITSEDTEIVKRRAGKLKLDYLFQGKNEGGKLVSAISICEMENISLDEVAYIGDDINCKELLQNVGIAACPSDAVNEIKNIHNIIHIHKKGGYGAFREFVELIINHNLLSENRN
jgi:YrbI family 3-deoxy-D-manno-octulosonate 8-phosphate phosphatase